MESVKQILSKVAIQAMTHFTEGHLPFFDALVSDQACQLRTIKVLKLYTQRFSLKTHHKKLIISLQKDEENGEKLTEDDKFLFLSHLLCITKEKNSVEKTQEKNLNQLIQNSTLEDKEITQIVYDAKRELSKRSIDFLKQEAKDLSLPEVRKEAKEVLKYIINRGIVYDRCFVYTSPLYFNMQILFENVRSRKTPLILIINCIIKKTMIKIAFRSLDKLTFREMKYLDAHERRGAVVVEGISSTSLTTDEYLKELLGTESQEDRIEYYPYSRVMEIFLTCSAKHPQYINRKNQIEIPAFQIEISGVKVKKEDQFVPMTPAILFGRVFEQAIAENRTDYRIILREIVGTPELKNRDSGKILRGLKSIFAPANYEAVCDDYVHRKVLEHKAEKAGLCRENSRLFAIKHIYPDLLGNHKMGENTMEFSHSDRVDFKSED
jgi:hypothetical protein